MDTVAGQPVIQPHGMSASGKGLGKGEFCPALVHEAPQCFTTGHAMAQQGRRQVDGLTVLVQAHQHGHVGGAAGVDAQL
ncbi:hypothetical protein D9M71_715310 [compost metagenome]